MRMRRFQVTLILPVDGSANNSFSVVKFRPFHGKILIWNSLKLRFVLLSTVSYYWIVDMRNGALSNRMKVNISVFMHCDWLSNNGFILQQMNIKYHI
jgi:hypothetical protein